MKRKIIALTLSLVLIFTVAIGISAQTDNADLISNPVNQTENVDSNLARAANSGISSDMVYRIRNVGSGKYLNLHYGVDADSTNVYQWTYDGSTEQKWRVAYNAGTDSYQFYSMSSSGGTNRLLDISRRGAALASGQNTALWTPTDTLSHEFQIISLGQNQYRIATKGNGNLFLAAYGNSNGTADGRSATSAGNVYISSYVDEMYQHWMFEPTGESVSPSISGALDLVSSTAISGWAYRSDLPNSPIDVHVYIDNYTTGETYAYNMRAANLYRPDLASLGYGNGYHGFSYTIPWEDLPSGTYSVTVYGIGSSVNPSLSGCPKSYTNISNITTGTKQTWNHSSYQGSYAPKNGWARPTFYKETGDKQNYANTYCEFTLDNYNVTNILNFNNGTHSATDKFLFLTLDITSVRSGTTDQMDAYSLSTSLPNPKSDLENDDPTGTRNEESDVTALGQVEPGTYYVSVMWYDYRNGGNNDNGRWQAQFAMSGQYFGTGDIWIETNGDYNNVYTSSAIQAIMPYGKNGGVE